MVRLYVLFSRTHRLTFCCRKTPWRLSRTRKANARARLKKVDAVIETVRASGVECAALVRFTFSVGLVPTAHMSQTQALELPKENEMPPKDKYTVYSPHEKGYRKGIHKVPKWTRVSHSQSPLCCSSTSYGDADNATHKPEGFLVLIILCVKYA